MTRLRLWILDMRRFRTVRVGDRIVRRISGWRVLFGSAPLGRRPATGEAFTQYICGRTYWRGVGGRFSNFRLRLCDSCSQRRALFRLRRAPTRRVRLGGRRRWRRGACFISPRCGCRPRAAVFTRCVCNKSVRYRRSGRTRSRVGGTRSGAIGTFLPFLLFFRRRLEVQLFLIDRGFDVRPRASVELARIPDAIVTI